MTQQEVIAQLRAVMKRSSKARVDWDAVQPDTKIEILGFDSLSILDLIYDIQQEFKLDFEAEEVVAIKTVGQLADFLMKKGA